MISDANHLSQPVMSIAHRDTVTVHQDVTIDEALQTIRQKGPSDRILYIYAVGEEDKLVGVLPLRQLLTAPLASRVSEVMIRSVVAIPEKASPIRASDPIDLPECRAADAAPRVSITTNAHAARECRQGTLPLP